MIENRLLRYALVLGERRNFARAAEALGLTQPTLSRSIAALERDLGVRLFERSHKGVTPTVFGRVLLERGAIVLEREAEVRREIQLLAGLEAGSLTVSAGPYFAEGVVATSIARVAVAHPGLRIKCHSPTRPKSSATCSPRRPTWASPRPPRKRRNRSCRWSACLCNAPISRAVPDIR
jgi:DNA-binding transcriptional LysR family regulator